MIFKLAREALLLVVWVIVALSPARSFTQELLRVPYGVTTSLQHLPILVGKDSGLFSKYGLNVEPVHIRGGALITTLSVLFIHWAHSVRQETRKETS